MFTLVATGQTPAAKQPAPLAFEVATIKESPPLEPAKMMSGQIRVGMKIDGARAEYNFLSLADLVCAAYKIKSYQLTGPDWMKTVRWDIQAAIPEGATKEQVPEMLQDLLKQRFKLEIHKDTKDHNVYALIQGKGGHKLKEAEPDPAPTPEGEAPPKEESVKDAKGPIAGSMTVNGEKMTMKATSNGMIMKGGEMGQIKTTMNNGMLRMEFAKVAMPAFAEMLTRFVDRPVNDETQLKGKYQVALDLSMSEMMNMARQAGMGPGGPGGGPPGAPGLGGVAGGGGGGGPRPAESASDPGGVTVFASVEQLGLKLTPRKGPVEMIVVDHLEKTPTEN